jgi:hypothetical protein
MAKTFVEQLESLSSYEHVYSPHTPEAKANPVNFQHLVLPIGGRQYHVLSRVGDAGLDYTQRTNKIAHHIALDATELVPGGPAWVLAQSDFMRETFAGEPSIIPAGRKLPAGNPTAAVCKHWQQVTGDAGWAGALAETALSVPTRHAVIVFRAGMKLLPLLAEALNLLPPTQRWRVSFSTYYSKLPPGVDCSWRCVLAGSAEATASLRLPGALVINLCEPMPAAKGGALVAAARSGQRPAAHNLEVEEPVGSTVHVGALARSEAPPASSDSDRPRLRAPAAEFSGWEPGIPRVPNNTKARVLSFGPIVIVAVLAVIVAAGGGFLAGMSFARRSNAETASVSTPVKSANGGREIHGSTMPVNTAKTSDHPPSAPNADRDTKDLSTNSAMPNDPPLARTDPPTSKVEETQSSEELKEQTNDHAATKAELSTASNPAPLVEDPWKQHRANPAALPLPEQAATDGEDTTLLVFEAGDAKPVIELIGLQQAFDPPHKAELIPKDNMWELHLSDTGIIVAGKARCVARFSYSSSHLRFSWGPDPLPTKAYSIADRMRNCMLRIQVGKYVSPAFPLHSATVCSPSTFQSDKVKPIEVKLPSLSKENAARVKVELVKVHLPGMAVSQPKGNRFTVNFEYGAAIGMQKPVVDSIVVQIDPRFGAQQLYLEAKYLRRDRQSEGGTKWTEVTAKHAGFRHRSLEVKLGENELLQRQIPQNSKKPDDTDRQKSLATKHHDLSVERELWIQLEAAIQRIEGDPPNFPTFDFRMFLPLEVKSSDGKVEQFKLVLTESHAPNGISN